MKQLIKQYAVPLTLIVALAGLLGSLYFSEVMGEVPCRWCWYQRIALYPLVPILAVGIAARDRAVWKYALPFSIIGTLMAIYHVLLTVGVFEETAACRTGVSCAAITWSFGFITIPVLSLAAFIIMTILLLLYKKYD